MAKDPEIDLPPSHGQDAAPAFDQVLGLAMGDGVLAYARISPSGHALAFAVDTRDGKTGRAVQVLKVVDLRSGSIAFTEPGGDPYWSNDGRRMIYISKADSAPQVSIWHAGTGAITRNIAPIDLGDYPSWGMRDGEDVVLTIKGNYFALDGDRASLPARHLNDCSGLGTGERPLISKNGRKATAFIRGHVVVRGIPDCEEILDTGVEGAKADFSWDGRYVAFHSLRPGGHTYSIQVVDVLRHSIRTLRYLSGSSYYPSWTRDGRLCFRYDGPEYRGFIVVRNVLGERETLLRSPAESPARVVHWSDVFPGVREGTQAVAVVVVWAPWNAHSGDALAALQRTKRDFGPSADVEFATALAPGSPRSDVERIKRDRGVSLRELPLRSDRAILTGALNQVPATIFFRDGTLQSKRLGALSESELRSEVERLMSAKTK